jgi:hypothetical protein
MPHNIVARTGPAFEAGCERFIQLLLKQRYQFSQTVVGVWIIILVSYKNRDRVDAWATRSKGLWFLDIFSGSVAWDLEFARHEIEHGKQVFRGSIAPRFSLGG